MKLRKIFLGIPFLSIFVLTGCGLFGGDDETPTVNNTYELYIQSSSDVYYLDKEDTKPVFSIDETKSKLPANINKNNLLIMFTDTGTTGAQLNYGNDYTVTNPGVFVVKGKLNDYESKNTISTTVRYSSEYIKDRIDHVIKGQPVFGQTYDLGIRAEDVSKYQVSGADGIIRFNADGKLEVCGIGGGTIKVKENGVEIYSYPYRVYQSIMCTVIQNILMEQSVISARTDNVTLEMLKNITKIDLAEDIQNDPAAGMGVQFLENLEEIDLSYNNLETVEFLKPLRKLKKINFSHNEISDIEACFNSRESLEFIDFSDNVATSLSALQTFTKLKYLDISDNNITNIDFISGVFSLESLRLNNNKLTKFSDGLSGLSNLKELALGYTGLTFTDIRSLSYINQLKYLDISDTSPTLDLIKNYTNLETLILKDCKIAANDQDLSKLNNLTNLKKLDLSNNKLFSANFVGKLNPSQLNKIEYLGIGGNEIDEVPALVSEFTNLKTLDLTNSYNLNVLSSVSGLDIEELILDDCNSIGDHFDNPADYATAFETVIESLPNLTHLSMVGGLNYVSESLYNYLVNRVNSNNLNLRLLENIYMNSETVTNYPFAIAFSMQTFESGCTIVDGENILSKGYRHFILVLTNDNSAKATSKARFTVPKFTRRIDIYGNKEKSYDIAFKFEPRKQATIKFNFFDFNDQISGADSFVSHPKENDPRWSVKRSLNSSIRTNKYAWTPTNCACDNGWNPNNQDSADWVYELKMDLLDFYLDGTTYSQGKNYITKSDGFSMKAKMRYDNDKIQFTDGRSDTRKISNDGNCGGVTIYGTNITADNGYGTLGVVTTYTDNSVKNYKRANFFQNKKAGDVINVFTPSDVNTAEKDIAKIDVYIAFEVEHWNAFPHWADKYSNWLYHFTFDFGVEL